MRHAVVINFIISDNEWERELVLDPGHEKYEEILKALHLDPDVKEIYSIHYVPTDVPLIQNGHRVL